MLANQPIHTTLPAADLERARRFYAEKLGLTPESEMLGGLFSRYMHTFVFPPHVRDVELNNLV